MTPRGITETAKPVEVEGFFDLYFYTPLGGAIAASLRRTRISPNQVSWLSVVAAATAAAAYLVQSLTGALVASALFLFSGILDSADGQLARTTGRTSELGETLDGFCDTLSFGLIYLAAATLLVVQHEVPLLLVAAIMIAAGISHSIQSSLVDFERQLFIHYSTDRGRVLREDPDLLRRDIRDARERGEGWWPQALRMMRLAYCRRQRRWLASSVALLELHRSRIHPFPERRRWFAERYGRTNAALLKSWTIFAPNSHTFAILLCGIAPFAASGIPLLGWGLSLVFLFDLLLNLALLPLILMQRRADMSLARQLRSLAADEGPVAMPLGWDGARG